MQKGMNDYDYAPRVRVKCGDCGAEMSPLQSLTHNCPERTARIAVEAEEIAQAKRLIGWILAAGAVIALAIAAWKGMR